MFAQKIDLDFFAAKILNELGIQYNQDNYYQLDIRLKDISKQLELADVNELRKRIEQNDLVATAMVYDLATNNETLFFRDTKVFTCLQKEIFTGDYFPISAKDNTLRIWSAASSFGQEIYSVAILLNELKDKLPCKNWHITASDYSKRALERAQKGEYTQLEVQRGLTTPRLIANFKQISNVEGQSVWRVNDNLRNNMDFKRINLIEPLPHLPKFDLVLCRNVLIYQSIKNKRLALERIIEYMHPGAILFLGAAENMIGITDKYETIRTENATFFRKPLN